MRNETETKSEKLKNPNHKSSRETRRNGGVWDNSGETPGPVQE